MGTDGGSSDGSLNPEPPPISVQHRYLAAAGVLDDDAVVRRQGEEVIEEFVRVPHREELPMQRLQLVEVAPLQSRADEHRSR